MVKNTAVTGEGFAKLKPLKKLRSLNVGGCADIEGYFMQLSDHAELRMLYVHDCMVAEDEVAELEGHNPRLAIFGDED